MRGEWPADPQRYRWIVDGHNAIFAHAELESLQTGGERAEARRMLEVMFDRLAVENGIDVLIVYDGNRIERNPDARREGRIRTQYSSSPDEEADDRILFLVQQEVRKGSKIAVVTSDRATLGARLPAGVLRVDPSAVFRRLRRREAARRRVERPPGDFSDIEAHFLSLGEAPPTAADDEQAKDSPGGKRGPRTPGRPRKRRPPSTDIRHDV
jgi:predicted RNA-binding protein with PIN domain